MKILLCSIVILLLFALTLPAFADGYIIYGEGFAFMVKPPKGWVADTKSGAKQGINVILYPEGSSPEAAGAFIYGRVIPKKKKASLDSIVSDDKKDFVKNCSGANVSDRSDLKISISNSSRSVDYTCPGQSYETVSFVDADKEAVVLFALTSPTPAARDKNLKNLEAVVNSFLWMTSRVLDKTGSQK